jgi:hypothetical protein
MRTGLIWLTALGAFSMLGAAGADLRSLDEPDPERGARVAWHREARFGCFVHWGVYSALGNEFRGQRGWIYAEHIMRVIPIPLAVYRDEVARSFFPERFDAEGWVRQMHAAGMRYLVITAKHHDGFAMYPSRVSDFNLTEVSRFKRDPMAELRNACDKYGLKFGFYYSHAFDWEHPDAPGNDWDYANPAGDRKLGGVRWWENHPDWLVRIRRYIDSKSIPQIRELVERYRPDLLWFDTPDKLPEEENRRILAAVRAMAPSVVVNGRIVANHGDYRNTNDRPVYVRESPGHWEAIPTTNESYAFSRFDHSHKTAAHFIRLLAQCVAKGGNMLLNIGPRGDGDIDEPDQRILAGLAGWMDRYAESIHGGDRSPLPVQDWGVSTRRGNRLYLHVFDWPSDGKLWVAGLRTDPRAIRLLGERDGVVSAQRVGPDDMVLTVPKAAPDPTNSVLALDFSGEIGTTSARLFGAGGKSTRLHVFDGRPVGAGMVFGDGKAGRDVIERWSTHSTGIAWPVRVMTAARYRLTVSYNTARPTDGGRFLVRAAGRAVAAQVVQSSDSTQFREQQIGEITLPAGEWTLEVIAEKVVGESLMRLRYLELDPLPQN